MNGAFAYYEDPETKKQYFACIVADATACCSQGLEFILTGDHTYPNDYPGLSSVITVTGTFETYEKRTGKKLYHMSPSHYDLMGLLEVQASMNRVR